MLHLDPSSAAFDAVPTDPSASARALVDGQIATLTRLTEMGMEIAEAATRRAVASLEGEAPAAGDHRDPSLAYARAARAVRQCIALQSRLLGDLPALERGERLARSEARQARKQQIVHLVKKAADADPDQAYVMAQVGHACWERLSDTDEYSEMMTLPLAEAVACICKDLGIPPEPWMGAVGAFEQDQPGQTLCAQAPPPIPLGSGGGGPRSCVVEGALGPCRPP